MMVGGSGPGKGAEEADGFQPVDLCGTGTEAPVGAELGVEAGAGVGSLPTGCDVTDCTVQPSDGSNGNPP